MLSFLIRLVVLALQLLDWLLFFYCLLSFVAPDGAVMEKLRPYGERLLDPFRRLAYRCFPQLARSSVDFSPLLVWALIQLAISLLNLLRGAL